MPETMVLMDGRRLVYATSGDKDDAPLVFHHGNPGTCLLGSLFDTVAREQNVRVIAPTRPGYGGSDPADTTLETWATDCEELARHLSLDSFTSAGFSAGGPFALAVAEQLSDRVCAVGLVGAIVPESDGGPLKTLSRVPLALGATLRAVRLVARVRGPEFVLGQFTAEPVDPSTTNAVSQDFRRACRTTGGRSAGEPPVRRRVVVAGSERPDPRVARR